MRQVLPAVATAILFSIGAGAPVLAQGFVDAAGLRGAGGFGAGIGAAAGTSKAKQLNSASSSSSAKLNQVAGSKDPAGNKYLLANKMEKAGKLAEAAALLAYYAAERQQLYGPGDNEVLKSYDRAAALATRAGKKADAEKYMRSALTVCQRTSGIGSTEAKQRMAKLETPAAAKAPETVTTPASAPGNAATKADQAQTPATPSDVPAAKP